MSKVYEIVQDKIIKEIEEAIANGGTTAPWRKPWKGGMPKNYISKKPYRGINLMLLDGGYYITFKQIQELQKKNPDIKLRKGSKSHMVVFWNFIEKENDDGEEEKIPFLRYYKVFHTSDVDGILQEQVEIFEHEPIERAEKLVDAYKEECPISIRTSNRASYSPSADRIVAPTIKQYEQVEEYYSTLFHEIVHSTGHQSRLKRFTGDARETKFGSKSYSKEELVAEIGANMVLSTLGIENDKQHENSIAYLYGWLTKLKSEPKMIIMAAQQAQKAADFILKFEEGFGEQDESIAI
jgi:antirestriction protein ArdC